MTTDFIDITGGDFDKAPFVSGGVRATYDTGLPPVPAAQAQIDAAKAAGMTVLLYDQWPGLATFAAGKSHMADVETDAGTTADVDAAIVARRALGLTVHTVYCSYNRLGEVKGSIADRTGVWFGVADYAWSHYDAVQLLAANPDWGYVQYGDPASNPLTVVPGTSVTLSQCNADINTASDAWLAAVAGTFPPPPPPPPAPPLAPAWPFGPYDYLATPRADPHCHSGYYDSVSHHVVAVAQQRLKDRGWTIEVDGFDGINEATLNQGQMPAVVHAFQLEKFGPAGADWLLGPKTWKALWELPVTP